MFNNDLYCTLDLRVLEKENKKYNLFNEANNTIETLLIDNTKPLTISIWCDIDPANVKIPKIEFNNEELLRFNLSTVIRKNQIYSITVYRDQDQLEAASTQIPVPISTSTSTPKTTVSPTSTPASVSTSISLDESTSGNYSHIVDENIYNKICQFNYDNCKLIGILKMKITQLGRHSSYTPNRDMFTLSDKNIGTFEKFGLAPKPHIYHEYISDKLHYFYDKYKDKLFKLLQKKYLENIFVNDSEITTPRKILFHTHNKGYSLICHKKPNKYVKSNNITYHFWRIKVKHGPIVSRNYIEIIVEVNYNNKTITIVQGFNMN